MEFLTGCRQWVENSSNVWSSSSLTVCVFVFSTTKSFMTLSIRKFNFCTVFSPYSALKVQNNNIIKTTTAAQTHVTHSLTNLIILILLWNCHLLKDKNNCCINCYCCQKWIWKINVENRRMMTAIIDILPCQSKKLKDYRLHHHPLCLLCKGSFVSSNETDNYLLHARIVKKLT